MIGNHSSCLHRHLRGLSIHILQCEMLSINIANNPRLGVTGAVREVHGIIRIDSSMKPNVEVRVMIKYNVLEHI